MTNADVIIVYNEPFNEPLSAPPCPALKAVKQLIANGYRLVDAKENWEPGSGFVRCTLTLRRQEPVAKVAA